LTYLFKKFIFTQWVSPRTLHGFVKNLSAPCYAIVLVKGIVSNGERRLAGRAEIFHKVMFNCGL
jgi:hypothetical protein